jgi:trans-2-enoyl-CoA reductase
MKDKHFALTPTKILDVDNGVDFTFKGMGLKGNRESEIDELHDIFLKKLSKTESTNMDKGILILKSYLDARLDIIQKQLDQLAQNEN